jgi:hypothetical protein
MHYVIGSFVTLDFALFAHLMFVILGYTNKLSTCLQRSECGKEPKCNNSGLIVGFNSFRGHFVFCKHDIEVFTMNDNYLPCENEQGMSAQNQKKS